jgi:hypothetical protein
MRIRIALSVLGLALAVQTGVQSTAQGAEPGMQAMQYYVGLWTCTGGAIGKPTAGTFEYRMDGAKLLVTVAVPVQGTPSRAWLGVETKYDAAKGVFVSTAFDNGGWDESYAKPWTGNTEEWLDHSTADGKLGRSRVVRVSQSEYTRTGYTTVTGSTLSYKLKCTRSR